MALGIDAHDNDNFMEKQATFPFCSLLPVTDMAVFVREEKTQNLPKDFLGREGWIEGGR